MIEYQIQEYKEKKPKWFYIILIICTILIIVLSAYFGIKFAKSKNEPLAENSPEPNTLEILKPTEIPEIVETPEPSQKPEVKKNKIPLYTEVGRKNIKKIFSYESEYKRVFLTFDDGPSSNITPLILDILKENNIKATFFTLGSRVEQNPQIVKRAYEEGHYIANHGYSHVYSSIYASEESLVDEYNRTEEAIRNAIEVPEYSSHLFRFPGGSVGGKYDKVKKEYVKNIGKYEIFYIDWNCLNEDATGNRTKEQLVQYVKDTSANKNSVVILMHDSSDKILTYETLQEVIDYFKSEGYVFENFYDVLEYELK